MKKVEGGEVEDGAGIRGGGVEDGAVRPQSVIMQTIPG